MGVHSFDKLGAKMGVHSFFWQRVRAVRHTKNMGAINGLLTWMKIGDTMLFRTNENFVLNGMNSQIRVTF